jgi:hypothetical protein
LAKCRNIELCIETAAVEAEEDDLIAVAVAGPQKEAALSGGSSSGQADSKLII